MSLKRKPTLIKFGGEDEKQKFLNWALEKSQPSKGINKAKDAMHSAQRNIELNSKRSELTGEVEIEVSRSSRPGHSSNPAVIKASLSRRRSRRTHAKRKRDGAYAITSNNRRG
ncbi:MULTISPECIES: hypothetical protein [Peribacillus]|uniref:hypothetical protein n=1 Tax=Peribacillus TaxID=2675229 RepID=UPI000BA6E586|nr:MULTISPECIES: hypothetical protein [Peribacillus]MDQ0882877.1 hypothetical protein [Peribacillus sp. V2I11]PAK42652.1 hypothetical protein CHI08_08805 [Peribacillus simplex]